jgi:hypothetical protein
MAVFEIKKNIDRLNVLYPPCDYDDNGPIGCIGETGCKSGVDPLRKSICLIIQLKEYLALASSAGRDEDDEIIFNDIFDILKEEVAQESKKLIIGKYGNIEKYRKLFDRYKELENELKTLLPINITLDDPKYCCKHTIKQIKNDLDKILTLKTEMLEIDQDMRPHKPSIRVYCRDGTLIYNQIRDHLYDLIKC